MDRQTDKLGVLMRNPKVGSGLAATATLPARHASPLSLYLLLAVTADFCTVFFRELCKSVLVIAGVLSQLHGLLAVTKTSVLKSQILKFVCSATR